MSDLADWFTREIRELGFAGLEGVYDYLATMSDGQVMEYIQSLLGSEKRIKDFATAYVQRRSQGMQQKASGALQGSSSDAEFDWAQASRATSKAKRNKGRQRKLSDGNKQSKQGNKSFAKAVSKPNVSSLDTEQTRAIRDAPVERIRQQVREYRKTKRPINCIYCGKVECPVQEDGTCSFCRSPIFSIWEPSEPRQTVASAATKTESVSSTIPKKSAIRYCAVLGRYVRRPIPYEDVYVQPELKDLAGNEFSPCLKSHTKQAMSSASFTSDAHSSTSGPAKLKEQSELHAKKSTRTRKANPLPSVRDYSVRGRLLVDDLRPSVCLPDL